MCLWCVPIVVVVVLPVVVVVVGPGGLSCVRFLCLWCVSVVVVLPIIVVGGGPGGLGCVGFLCLWCGPVVVVLPVVVVVVGPIVFVWCCVVPRVGLLPVVLRCLALVCSSFVFVVCFVSVVEVVTPAAPNVVVVVVVIPGVVKVVEPAPVNVVVGVWVVVVPVGLSCVAAVFDFLFGVSNSSPLSVVCHASGTAVVSVVFVVPGRRSPCGVVVVAPGLILVVVLVGVVVPVGVLVVPGAGVGSVVWSAF